MDRHSMIPEFIQTSLLVMVRIGMIQTVRVLRAPVQWLDSHTGNISPHLPKP